MNNIVRVTEEMVRIGIAPYSSLGTNRAIIQRDGMTLFVRSGLHPHYYEGGGVFAGYSPCAAAVGDIGYASLQGCLAVATTMWNECLSWC